ncbi:MAG: phosphate ABC transporter permease subunit PstC [Dehalococcoidia bacterium]|nr:phosphate ABC transporter permease subunit PstC [Dehalococcoidia bacterium]
MAVAPTTDQAPRRSLAESVRRRRTGAVWEGIVEAVIYATGLLTILLLIGILLLLGQQGLRLFFEMDYPVGRFFTFGNAITENTSDPEKFRFGIMAPLIATGWVTLVTLVIAVPLGLATAVYISEIAPPRVRLYIKSGAELLAGVPTVLFGFVGLFLLVPIVRETFGWGAGGMSGMTAGIVVAFIAVPLIISIADDALQAVPVDFKENAYALGCNQLQAIWFVIMPAAISGITAAVMLGMARAIGETMTVLILGGGNSSIPELPTESMRTMTATIASGFGNASAYSLLRPALFMTGAVLFLITMFTTIIADLVLDRQRKRFSR